MKRSTTRALIIIGSSLTVLLLGARITGGLQYYKIPTPSNEPNIKIGDHVFASSFKKIFPKCFIVFTSKYEDSLNATYMEEPQTGSHYLHRLCAVAGDEVEMRNGVLFVNGQNFDAGLNLKNQFILTVKEFEELIDDADKLNDTGGTFIPFKDSMLACFDDQMKKKYELKIKLSPYIITDTSHGPFKWLDKNSTWTTDNFGPLKIPPGCYFVLGDNRHNTLDSRYIGFIKKDDIKGVVLNK